MNCRNCRNCRNVSVISPDGLKGICRSLGRKKKSLETTFLDRLRQLRQLRHLERIRAVAGLIRGEVSQLVCDSLRQLIKLMDSAA